MNEKILPPETIKERLVALIQAVLLDNNQLEDMVRSSNFKSHFKPVIVQLVKQFPNLIEPMLASVSEDDIARVLEMMRDEFIPFLLDEHTRVYEDTLPPPRVVSSLEEFNKLIENENSPSG